MIACDGLVQPLDDTDYTGALGGKPMSRDEVLMDQITLLPMASNEPTPRFDVEVGGSGFGMESSDESMGAMMGMGGMAGSGAASAPGRSANRGAERVEMYGGGRGD